MAKRPRITLAELPLVLTAARLEETDLAKMVIRSWAVGDSQQEFYAMARRLSRIRKRIVKLEEALKHPNLKTVAYLNG